MASNKAGEHHATKHARPSRRTHNLAAHAHSAAAAFNLKCASVGIPLGPENRFIRRGSLCCGLLACSRSDLYIVKL